MLSPFILKIVLYIFTGIMLGRMGPNGSALVNFCQSLNEAVLRIVAIVIWYGFLYTILQIQD